MKQVHPVLASYPAIRTMRTAISTPSALSAQRVTFATFAASVVFWPVLLVGARTAAAQAPATIPPSSTATATAPSTPAPAQGPPRSSAASSVPSPSGPTASSAAPATMVLTPEPPSPVLPVVRLASLERDAVARQPQVLIARSQTLAEEGVVEQARSPYLPQVTATGQYSFGTLHSGSG